MQHIRDSIRHATPLLQHHENHPWALSLHTWVFITHNQQACRKFLRGHASNTTQILRPKSDWRPILGLIRGRETVPPANFRSRGNPSCQPLSPWTKNGLGAHFPGPRSTPKLVSKQMAQKRDHAKIFGRPNTHSTKAARCHNILNCRKLLTHFFTHRSEQDWRHATIRLLMSAMV